MTRPSTDDAWRLPDALWERLEPLLPPAHPKPPGGRPRMLYVLRTDCQWKRLPRSVGAASTVHDRFQEWQRVRGCAALADRGARL